MRRSEGSRLDPEELGARLAAGDREAAAALHDEFYADLCRHLGRRLNGALSPAWRDEVIAIVLGRMMKKPQHYRPGRMSVLGFLRMCVYREALKKIEGEKGKGRRAAEMLSPRLAASELNGDGVPPWKTLIDEEDAAFRLGVLYRLIPRLSEEHQEVVLHYLEHGKNYSEVLALKRGETKGTIQTRLFRATEQLAAMGGAANVRSG